MSVELLQPEADALLALEKYRVNSEQVAFPYAGRKLSVDLVCARKRERFLLDINRSAVSLSKVSMQTRVRTMYVLARLDLDGAPHRNPDDEEIFCPHLHLYREGFGTKWAYAVPPEHFKNLTDRWQTLHDFMRFCRIIEPPVFYRELFS